MGAEPEAVVCRLKEIRQAKGLSQSQVAEYAGVKRQAIYDMESGKYVPNTAVALRLARLLLCRVEDLFYEKPRTVECAVTVLDPANGDARVEVAKVRGNLVGYPLSGSRIFDHGFRSADGILKGEGKVELLCSEESLDRSIILLGCDPAFSVLNAHMLRQASDVRMHCRFTSSYKALEGLGKGHAHLAGTHLHNTETGEANVAMARQLLQGAKAKVIAFSLLEEGLMVAKGNPFGIRGVSDLAGGKVRLINREPGAALRTLLDDLLAKAGILPEAVAGYQNEVTSHLDGANMVAFNLADAALGFRAVAGGCGLDFVPLQVVRCDLVIPEDLMTQHPMRVLLDTLQTAKLRQELESLPGYEASRTGTVIAEL